MRINVETRKDVGVLSGSFLRIAEVSDGPNGQKHTVAAADTDDLVLRIIPLDQDELPNLKNLKLGDPVEIFIDFTASHVGKPVGIRPLPQGEIR